MVESWVARPMGFCCFRSFFHLLHPLVMFESDMSMCFTRKNRLLDNAFHFVKYLQFLLQHHFDFHLMTGISKRNGILIPQVGDETIATDFTHFLKFRREQFLRSPKPVEKIAPFASAEPAVPGSFHSFSYVQSDPAICACSGSTLQVPVYAGVERSFFSCNRPFVQLLLSFAHGRVCTLWL